jgi:glucosamine-6-phosphate deaminase
MKKTLHIGKLQVHVYNEPVEMGTAAAGLVEKILNRAIQVNGSANLILATGTSQFTFLKALEQKVIDWQRITVFHLDEYVGIPASHPASFRRYLKERILDKVAPKQVYFLNGDTGDLHREIKRYEDLLKERPVDLACIGIGENGHIAFNDPAVANFNDPQLVKQVELDRACKNQQLGEGWFPGIEEVPKHALTLTIPAILNCKAISCVVPDKRKAEAVYNSLYGEITPDCPASILRSHPHTTLFLDAASASNIEEL